MDLSQLPVNGAELRSLPAKFYPLFDCCHIVLCVLAVRKEAGRKFGWNHPLATWLSCVVSSFAGSLLANPLLGKLDFLNDTNRALLLYLVLSTNRWWPNTYKYHDAF